MTTVKDYHIHVCDKCRLHWACTDKACRALVYATCSVHCGPKQKPAWAIERNQDGLPVRLWWTEA